MSDSSPHREPSVVPDGLRVVSHWQWPFWPGDISTECNILAGMTGKMTQLVTWPHRHE